MHREGEAGAAMTALDRHRALLAQYLHSQERGGWATHHWNQVSKAAVEAHPFLLDLWAAALECSEAVSDRSGGPIDRMRDILAKLEAMQ